MEYIRLNIKVPVYVNELLTEESKKNGMSKSAVVNLSIQNHLGLLDSHKKITYEDVYSKFEKVLKQMENKIQNQNKK